MPVPLIPDWARRSRLPAGDNADDDAPPLVVVVGPCASGKTTLCASLAAQGLRVMSCAQEHSDIPHLWALNEPAFLIYLAVDLDEVRRRRGAPRWSETLYQRQLRRLAQARNCCDLQIDTSRRSPAEVLAQAWSALRAASVQGHNAAGPS